MKFKKILFIGLAAAMVSTTAFADKLRVGVEAAYPPFSFKNSDGSLGGFDIDISLEICERLNRECELVEQEWDGMIPGLLAKKYDVIVASMSITEERMKKVDFTDKYYQTLPGLIAHKDADFAPTNDGLKGKRVGVLRATTNQCTIETMFPDAEMVLYNTQDEVFQDLSTGRLDAQLSPSLQALEGFLKQDMGKDFAFLGDMIKDPACQGKGTGIALRKDNEELREAMNAAIKAMREDGKYKELNDKYFDIDIYGS